MATIFDIAPRDPEKVEIRGITLEIRGIKNAEFSALCERFPELRKQMQGQPTDGLAGRFDLIPAVIAAGLGQCGDASAETAVVERLSIGEQTDLCSRILKLTMPTADAGPLADVPAAGSA